MSRTDEEIDDLIATINSLSTALGEAPMTSEKEKEIRELWALSDEEIIARYGARENPELLRQRILGRLIFSDSTEPSDANIDDVIERFNRISEREGKPRLSAKDEAMLREAAALHDVWLERRKAGR